jgi:eukaryotic-like serine/threonine-protein kinase
MGAAAVIILLITILSGCGAAPIHGWSGAAVSGNNLYIASNNGTIVGIDSVSRNKLFSDLALAAPSSSGGFLGCGAAIVNVSVYSTPAVSTELNMVYAAGFNGRIYAISSDTGEQRWAYPSPAGITNFVGGLLLYNKVLYIGGTDGKVYAVDAETGNPPTEWLVPFKTGNQIYATPTADGNTLFIGSLDKSLYAVNLNDGTEKWHYKTGGAIINTPVIKDGVVYFGSFDRYFYALNENDGTLIWKSENNAGNWFWGNAVLNNGIIYAPNFDGKVYIYDSANGSEVTAPVNLGSPIASTPAIAANKLIAATEDGKSDGKIWIISTTDYSAKMVKDLKDINTSGNTNKQVYAPLVYQDLNGTNIVYIHTRDNTLIAFNADSEIILWSQPVNS